MVNNTPTASQAPAKHPESALAECRPSQSPFRMPFPDLIFHGGLPSSVLLKTTSKLVRIDFQGNCLVTATIQESANGG